MKKSTEELILSEIILLKTEVLKTSSKVDSLEKEMRMGFKSVNERFDEMELRQDIAEEKLDVIMEQSTRYFLEHDKRLLILETA